MGQESYLKIYKHYENTLDKHGANHKGMDWPDEGDLKNRFDVMSELIKISDSTTKSPSILDLGCGVGLLLDYFKNQNSKLELNYHGLDISEKMIAIAKKRHKGASFETRDILTNPLDSNSFQYIIMNGLLTEKVTLSQSSMKKFAQKIILTAFNSCSIGIAFNVMSSHVDWKRKDLFHWPLDELVGFLTKNLSRNIVIRMDYGLYEFTTYVYKQSTKDVQSTR